MNIKRLGMNDSHRRRNVIMRLGVFITMICMYCSNMIFVAAGTNYGETIGKWILEQLFWVAIVVIIIALVGCLLKRAYAAGGIIILVGAIVCYFIKNPTKLSTIGDSLGNTFGF